MLIGLPKEIKNHEYRVGLTPASVRELTAHGHQVLVQTGAGAAIGLSDEQYLAAGATLAPDAQLVFAKADMIVKVKEPQPQECAMRRPGQSLYTYLHLAPDPDDIPAEHLRRVFQSLDTHLRRLRRLLPRAGDGRARSRRGSPRAAGPATPLRGGRAPVPRRSAAA